MKRGGWKKHKENEFNDSSFSKSGNFASTGHRKKRTKKKECMRSGEKSEGERIWGERGETRPLFNGILKGVKDCYKES